MPGLPQSPDTLMTLVPLDWGVPMAVYHYGPLRTIFTTSQSVSTLFTTVGFCR